MSVQVQRRTRNSNLTLPDSVPPLLARIYRQRNLTSPQELDLGLANLLPPDTLRGMPEAIALLYDCLQQDGSILVVGDFDADGATSCALTLTALRQFGASRVNYIVPNRFEYGYGLTPEIVELARGYDPALLITVDNGISSIDGVQAAQAAGMKVLVTDHHLAGRELPPAEAIINPNQPECNFASKSIAGVGVIFYVMMALRSHLREQGWFEQRQIVEPRLADLLDLVALGTVADVVALDRNNRILVDEGLKRIRAGRTRPGINALLQVAKREAATLSASDMGFAIGPRLNAAGRLDDMSTGIECLLSQLPGEAYQLALQLDGMNQDRKQIEADMREQAFAALGELQLDEQTMPAALSLFDARWHQGVVGILASRIKEKFHRPVIAFAAVSEDANTDNADLSMPGIELKGSARSIPGFHIRDALDTVATENPGLIRKFGGHAMAAGLSLDSDRFDDFSAAFAEVAARQLQADQLQALILSDGEIAASELSLETAQLLQAAGPWGQAFPEPIFDGHFLLVNQRTVGEKHLKMVLSPPDSPQLALDAIAFFVDAEDWPPQTAQRIQLAYRLDINEFRGRVTLQLMVEHILGWE